MMPLPFEGSYSTDGVCCVCYNIANPFNKEYPKFRGTFKTLPLCQLIDDLERLFSFGERFPKGE